MSISPSRLSCDLNEKVDRLVIESKIPDAFVVGQLAKQAVASIDKAATLLSFNHTVEMIQALFILPLE